MYCGHAEHFADNQQYWISAGYTQPHLGEYFTLNIPPIGLFATSILFMVTTIYPFVLHYNHHQIYIVTNGHTLKGDFSN